MTPYENALTQVKKAAETLQQDISFLDTPDRILQADLEVTMDSGEQKKFPAYRVQYNNLRGPYKGGIRYHPEANLDEVKALALLMAIKCSVANIPMGGGKGGVTVNPKQLSAAEVERLSRAYVNAFYKDLGPDKDVPAPDVYTTPQIMAWMVDEYSKLVGHAEPAMITGKPIDAGGSEGRDVATAQGGVYVLESLQHKLALGENLTIAIQGFGNAGLTMAELLHAAGHQIVAVADSKGSIHSTAGLNIDAVKAHKASNGSVKDFADAENITDQELFALPVDILVLAALDNQITASNASSVQAKVILELANGPVSPEADDILQTRNVIVVPDVLANSGGVIVSYLEWKQNLAHEHWEREKVLSQMKELIVDAFEKIYALSVEQKTSLRRAAFILALQRLIAAKK